jgi:uncharacterized circularly permuted ATP-grasp superfamily protein
VLDRIDELVIKPVEGSGGYGIVFGPDASRRNWRPSAARSWRPARLDRPAGGPVVDGADQGRRQPGPRHVDLRPFAVNDGDDVWVLPGGLTRVALPRALVVNSSQGGGSKDTWVLASRVGGRAGTRRRRDRAQAAETGQAADGRAGPEQSGQQQGQQQQQQQQQQAVMR